MDLCGLLNITPTGSKTDEPHEFQVINIYELVVSDNFQRNLLFLYLKKLFFQPNYVVNKIKSCSKLEKDTDVKLKSLKEHNPKIQFDDNLIGALKGKYTLLELSYLRVKK